MVFVTRDYVHGVEQVLASPRLVVVAVGRCRMGSVHGQCGAGVHAMSDWLDSMVGLIENGDWVLL